MTPSPRQHQPSPRRASPLWLTPCLVGFVLFVITFPKGGIKLNDIPLTWSYLYLGLGILLPALFIFLSGKVIVNAMRFLSLLLLLPIQAIIVISFAAAGYDDFGNFTALLVNWIVLPLLLIVAWGILFDAYPLDPFLRALRTALPCIAFFGLFLFLYKIRTGDYFQIPYLTVNVDDMDSLGEKHNMRGDVSKLIATYNNGNIYGVCTLMLYPLYRILEKRLLPQWIVLAALILTLSRTVWIGIILCELLHLLWVRKSNARMWLNRLLFLSVPALLGLLVFYLMGYSLDFILDPDLGGRAPQIDNLQKIHLFRFESFDNIREIVYLSVLDLYGLAGLVFWILGMLSCLLLYFLGHRQSEIPEFKKSLILGMVVYLILSGSDGAFLLIPTMSIYWLLSSLLLSPHKMARLSAF